VPCDERGVRGSDLVLVSEQEVPTGQADELAVRDPTGHFTSGSQPELALVPS
jgi:hypothetical protein